jgi:hypothetical protein
MLVPFNLYYEKLSFVIYVVMRTLYATSLIHLNQFIARPNSPRYSAEVIKNYYTYFLTFHPLKPVKQNLWYKKNKTICNHQSQNLFMY